MDYEQIKSISDEYYMNTFGDRLPIIFSHGKGCTLFSDDGKAYTDFLAGIAVCALGYGDSDLTDAITQQAGRLIHCSNYFYTKQQAELARILCDNSCADKVFFANSGAEANEGAIKLARKYFYAKGQARFEIITMNNSFHGRTLATIAATGQEKYQRPFSPMPQGFVHVPYGDSDAVREKITNTTAAILVEPIQGEGGVIEGGREYLQELRRICDENDLLLIFDEIQCGMGRTGSFCAHDEYGVEPDVFTLAKALAGGVPIGAVLSKAFCASFEPGDHGTTFGGNPLACAAGIAVCTKILGDGFLQSVVAKGKLLKDGLLGLKAKHDDKILDVRGRGLMLGMELMMLPVKRLQMELLDKGFITGTAGKNTLRLVPPLVISEGEIYSLLNAMDEILKGW